MGDRSGEADQRAAMEDRHRHGDVGQVTGGEPRVVGDDAVARLPGLLRKPFQEMLQGARQDAGEGRDAAGVFRQRVAIRIHQHGTEIVRLADDGRKGRAQQRRRGFVRDRNQPAPEDFQGDGIEIVGHGGSIVGENGEERGDYIRVLAASKSKRQRRFYDPQFRRFTPSDITRPSKTREITHDANDRG